MVGDDIFRSPDTLREQRVPPGQRLTEKWPTLHHGTVPPADTGKWTLRIFGLVEIERTPGYAEFAALPRRSVLSDIHCVTGWSRLNNTWEGVGTGELHRLVNILPEARFVMVHGAQGFTTNLSLEDFFAEDALFAFQHDREPLTAEHGGPVRLVVPRLYFWKSAKWVEGVEFMARDKAGFWESNGYHLHGDPWKEERYG
jgi:DMSO/TMAO reductase YedYZ molybdopterin-dependent catalytic subunit